MHTSGFGMEQVIRGSDRLTYQSDWVEWASGSKKYVHAWSDRLWTNGAAPIATVCIVHGLGEHGGRYANLASGLVAAGFRVLAFDQQGHGLSHEPRGCITSYDSLLDDIGSFLDWAKQAHPQPIVLFGHSMGGNLVLNYALRRSQLPTGVISSSPMIEAVRNPGKLYRILARMLLVVAPNFRLQSEVIPERLMSDPAEQQALRDDDLFHSNLSLRLGAALLDSGSWALNHSNKLSVPTLLTHGTQDFLTCPKASANFAMGARGVCQLEILDGSLHDPFRGTERAEVIKKFVDFATQVSSEQDR